MISVTEPGNERGSISAIYQLFEKDANLSRLRKDERFIAFIAKLKQQWERYQATL